MMSELFSKLQDYINGALSREQFSVWFFEASWQAEKKVHGSALDFIYDVELILAESSSGHWSEADLKEELQDLLDTIRSVQFEADPSLWRGVQLAHLVFGPLRV